MTFPLKSDFERNMKVALHDNRFLCQQDYLLLNSSASLVHDSYNVWVTQIEPVRGGHSKSVQK
jgi:hypothetical protein